MLADKEGDYQVMTSSDYETEGVLIKVSIAYLAILDVVSYSPLITQQLEAEIPGPHGDDSRRPSSQAAKNRREDNTPSEGQDDRRRRVRGTITATKGATTTRERHPHEQPPPGRKASVCWLTKKAMTSSVAKGMS
jgi:hypothetical protein